MTKSSKALAAFVIGAAVGVLVGYFLKTENQEVTDRKVVRKTVA